MNFLQEYKINEKPFCCLPQEMQQWMKDHPCQMEYIEDGIWQEGYLLLDFEPETIYRLRPDYNEIRIDIPNKLNGGYFVQNGAAYVISEDGLYELKERGETLVFIMVTKKGRKPLVI